jgi:hypothetical protein
MKKITVLLAFIIFATSCSCGNDNKQIRKETQEKVYTRQFERYSVVTVANKQFVVGSFDDDDNTYYLTPLGTEGERFYMKGQFITKYVKDELNK